MKYRTAIVLMVIICAVIVVLVAPNEKKRLANDIRALKNAVEKENKTLTLAYIDNAYLDKKGLNYSGFTQIIDNLIRETDSISISMSGMKLKIDSVTSSKTIFASCSLGLRIFAKSGGDKVLIYGGVIQPAGVKGFFKKTSKNYRLYSAEY